MESNSCLSDVTYSGCYNEYKYEQGFTVGFSFIIRIYQKTKIRLINA